MHAWCVHSLLAMNADIRGGAIYIPVYLCLQGGGSSRSARCQVEGEASMLAGSWSRLQNCKYHLR